MNPSHDELRDLVLVYEELDADERRRADAHLATCASCSELLARLQRVERSAADAGAIPPLDELAAAALEPAERRAADESLATLRRQLELDANPDRSPAPAAAGVAGTRERARQPALRSLREWLAGPHAPRWALAAAPVAAVVIVAAVVLWPRTNAVPPRPLVSGARLAPYSELRGGSGTGWQIGEAFVIEFDLAAAARPVVFHVDPGGGVALLHPANPGEPPPLESAGRVTLPRRDQGIEWRFEGEPGQETFLIAAGPAGEFPLAALAAEATRLGGADRAAIVAALRALLERRVGSVQAIEATHLP